jgi:carboxyl-terminal processing protease
MLGRLGQSHFGVIPSGRYGSDGRDRIARRLFSAVPDDIARPGPGIDLRRIDGAFLVCEVWEGGAAREAGVEPGWELVAIDGESCTNLLSRLTDTMREIRGREWSPEEAPYMTWALIQAALAGEDSSTVELAFRDSNGRPVAVALRRRACPWPVVSASGMPELPLRVEARRLESPRGRHAVGVIAIRFFWLPGVRALLEESLKNLGEVDAMVIDIRGNLGGASRAMRGVVSYLVGSAVSLGETVARDGEMPMTVLPRHVGVHGDPVQPFTGPLAILTDRLTGSASELFAAGLMDNGRARVFGEPTAGAALPAIVSVMPNGDKLIHAAFDFVRATGESLEGRPLQPDVVAPLTREALVHGEDPALDAALTWLAAQLARR